MTKKPDVELVAEFIGHEFEGGITAIAFNKNELYVAFSRRVYKVRPQTNKKTGDKP